MLWAKARVENNFTRAFRTVHKPFTAVCESNDTWRNKRRRVREVEGLRPDDARPSRSTGLARRDTLSSARPPTVSLSLLLVRSPVSLLSQTAVKPQHPDNLKYITHTAHQYISSPCLSALPDRPLISAMSNRPFASGTLQRHHIKHPATFGA
jgi:hypothetical protein